ncbi:MAG: class I SAM-dependent methyltransferase [Polyangiaceae bacterium]|nr:class I SAM-dependent methyltransferase [Polyangiaceae bacterium]
MWGKDGPTFLELAHQALSGTARGYDLLAPKFEATPFCTPEPVLERTLSDLGQVRQALDLCCGTGMSFGPLRTIVTDRIVGVDFSEGMLAVAREKIGLSQKPQIELIHRDILSFDGGAAFDLVTCFGALGHFPEQDEPRFLSCVRNALKPGGRFVFLTSDLPPLWSRRRIVSRLFNAAMHVRNALVQPPFVMYYLTFLLPDIERHLKWHGFDVAVHRGLFEKPFDELVRIVATKR